MTSPVGGKPESTQDKYDDVHSKGSSFGQDLNESKVRGLLSGQVKNPFQQAWKGATNFLDNIIGGIASAIGGSLGLDSPFSPVQDAFQDAQHKLTSRLDLLEGVEAYAQGYMSKNRNGEWGTNNWRTLAFDTPLGPSKGARVDPSKGGIVLDSTGLWTVYARITGRETNYTGHAGVTMDVMIYYPNGDVYSQQRVRGTSLVDAGALIANRGSVTLQATFPVVIDTPGCYIQVDAWSAAWRWWEGGTRWSSLSVLKHSSDIVNPGEDTVPDETK